MKEQCNTCKHYDSRIGYCSYKETSVFPSDWCNKYQANDNEKYLLTEEEIDTLLEVLEDNDLDIEGDIKYYIDRLSEPKKVMFDKEVVCISFDLYKNLGSFLHRVQQYVKIKEEQIKEFEKLTTTN